MTDFDLIVIGAGPGGYVAAIRASQLGMSVAIIERENLGGICLNWGCIPTKALLRSAEVLHLAKSAAAYGLKVDKADFDLEGVVKRSRGVAAQLSGGVKHLMKKNKITVIEGEARLEKGTPAPKVVVKDAKGKDTTYAAKHVLLATGARARAGPQRARPAQEQARPIPTPTQTGRRTYILEHFIRIIPSPWNDYFEL